MIDVQIIIFITSKQFITNHLTNYISNTHNINNTDNVSTIKKDVSTNKYITNVFRRNNDYIGNNMYKKYDNITFNTTTNITTHINNYSNDVTNNYNIDKINAVTKTYYNFNDDITLNKTSSTSYNDTCNITKHNNLFNITDNRCIFTKNNFNTHNITNTITRHNHNNYEHNVIKQVHVRVTHINNYDTEINYYTKKSHTNSYYNFYNDYFNFRKIENISLTQHTDITNNITEPNAQTINYVDGSYIKNDKITIIILNTVAELSDNYIWIPEGIYDNVVPGLDSMLTYIQSTCATLTALHNYITNINNTINNDIQIIQTTITNIKITNPQHVSKESHYHTSNTDFMYHRNTTNNDNRKHIVPQNHYFTFQRQYSTNN